MRITLSTSELPELVEKNATYEPVTHSNCRHTHSHLYVSSYQPPTCRKLSKSAKGRARKRAKALRQTQIADETGLIPMEEDT
jgi:hypothetical protein